MSAPFIPDIRSMPIKNRQNLTRIPPKSYRIRGPDGESEIQKAIRFTGPRGSGAPRLRRRLGAVPRNNGAVRLPTRRTPPQHHFTPGNRLIRRLPTRFPIVAPERALPRRQNARFGGVAAFDAENPRIPQARWVGQFSLYILIF